MKTTIEIPDSIYRIAKARAALMGIPMTKYVSDALQDKARAAESDESGEPPWMRGFGELSDLHDETRRINTLTAHEFSEIDPEDAQ